MANKSNTLFIMAAALLCGTMTGLAHHEHGATSIVKWALPAVRCDRVLQAVRSTDGTFNEIVYWSRLPDWKNQMLAADPDAIYVLPFLNTQATGPMVIEIPASEDTSVRGTVSDCWQKSLEDLGPAGELGAAGGKYLVLPPDFAGTPPSGYVVIRPRTFLSYAVMRLMPKSRRDRDVSRTVAYARQIRLYPLSQSSHPRDTSFIDAAHMEFDATVPYDFRFFQSLDRVVQNEPWVPGGFGMIDALKSVGIEKGKPFTPDADAQTMLATVARESRALLAARDQSVFTEYYEDRHWAVWEKDDGRLGLLTLNDANGRPLDGSNTYRLVVPPHVPATGYWSAAVYDRSTHAFIRNLPWPGRSSESPGLQTNPDGTVDIYFGPRPPAGKEQNWIPTTAYGDFEVAFRLNGPEPPVFDRTWQLQDVERVK